MTKEEIKNRASNLHTMNYKGIECVTLTTAATFAEHISELTMQETLEEVCKCLDEMTVVPSCIVDTLYEKVKTKMMS